jgi:hypothetical protein
MLQDFDNVVAWQRHLPNSGFLALLPVGCPLLKLQEFNIFCSIADSMSVVDGVVDERRRSQEIGEVA